MEVLSKEISAIRKISSARLITKLLQSGVEEETVDAMDREALVAAWAECVASGKDTETPAETQEPHDSLYEMECFMLEQKKLAFEQQKFEAEHALRLKELESQERLKQAELKLLELKHASEQKERDSVVMRAKRYGEALKASLAPMGPDAINVVLFFKHVESVFARYEVPSDLQVALLQRYLNAKSRSVVARMDPSRCNKYVDVCDVILKEHKLSPCTYLDFFNTLTRAQDETYCMYAARLQSLLNMYVESRTVDSFELLKDLLVSDRIKSTLSEPCLRYVLSVEAATKTGYKHLSWQIVLTCLRPIIILVTNHVLMLLVQLFQMLLVWLMWIVIHTGLNHWVSNLSCQNITILRLCVTNANVLGTQESIVQ